MEEPTCKDCKHFRPHYIKFDKGRFDPIVYPRIKHRTVDTPACVHFQKAEKPEA